jgi:hypothetical protein
MLKLNVNKMENLVKKEIKKLVDYIGKQPKVKVPIEISKLRLKMIKALGLVAILLCGCEKQEPYPYPHSQNPNPNNCYWLYTEFGGHISVNSLGEYSQTYMFDDAYEVGNGYSFIQHEDSIYYLNDCQCYHCI